jgi:hypothetical protein
MDSQIKDNIITCDYKALAEAIKRNNQANLWTTTTTDDKTFDWQQQQQQKQQ